MSDTRMTRGRVPHLRLQKSCFRSKYDTRKFYFAYRVVDHWNSLPNWVVTAINSLQMYLLDIDNVAINDVLPLKAARRDAISNLKCFPGLGHQRPNFNGYTMRRHLIRLASAPCISSRLATFVWVRFLRATRGKHNAEFTKGTLILF